MIVSTVLILIPDSAQNYSKTAKQKRLTFDYIFNECLASTTDKHYSTINHVIIGHPHSAMLYQFL